MSRTTLITLLLFVSLAPTARAAGDSVIAAQPQITLTASSHPQLGGAMNASATVTGRVNPADTDTVEFRLERTSSCSGQAVFKSVVPYPVSGGPVTSETFSPRAAGEYYWCAVYSGNADDPAVESCCVASPVRKYQATLKATPTPDTVVGGVIAVSVMMTGYGGSGPTPLTYRLHASPDCTGAVVGNVGIAQPDAGRYSWRVSFAGDENNEAVEACSAPVEVRRATPTLTVSAPAAAPLTASAAVNGVIRPRGGTVDFLLFDTPDCSGTPVYASRGVPIDGATASLTAGPGTYRLRVVYSGDVNNAPVTSPCGEPRTVAAPPPTVALVTTSPVTPAAPPTASRLTAVTGTRLRVSGRRAMVGCQLDAPSLRTCTVTLKVGKRTLGRGTVTLPRTGSSAAKVAVTLSAAGRRAVRKAGRKGLPATLALSAEAFGTSRRFTATALTQVTAR